MTPNEYELVLTADRSWLALDLRSVWQYRDLIYILVWRDFVAKYKQTLLGPIWFIAQPLLMTLVFTVIFGRVVGLSTDGLPQVLFYLAGQLGWNYFAQTFWANSATLQHNAAVFSKVYFPRLVAPLSILFSNLFAFVVQAITFAAFYLYFRYAVGDHSFGARPSAIVLLPLLVMQTAVLSLGVGLIVAAITAKFRDVAVVGSLIVQVWMYATPVIYPLSQLPERWRWVMGLNPMTAVIESYRLLLLGRGEVTLPLIATSLAMTTICVLVGLISFTRVERTFVDVV